MSLLARLWWTRLHRQDTGRLGLRNTGFQGAIPGVCVTEFYRRGLGRPHWESDQLWHSAGLRQRNRE